MDLCESESFLKKGKYIWSKRVVTQLKKILEEIKSSGTAESSERCFVEFILELDSAYKAFLQNVKDLPMIMNCRARGNNKSHFGGQECAELASDFRQAAEKYLNLFSRDVSEGTVSHIATTIKEKARKDEMYAREFESRAAKDYLASGIDNTLNILKESGYNI